VYLEGTQPTWLSGEREKGMTKEPIMIEPTDAQETMERQSERHWNGGIAGQSEVIALLQRGAK
jgi:hypothetical protein